MNVRKMFTGLTWIFMVSLCGSSRSEGAGESGQRRVLFYAGFDGGRDAVSAAGYGKADLVAGGGAITADGFDSIRRSALKTGDELGFLEFAGPGNVLPESGTIEFWLKPGDWARDDGKRHCFIEIVAENGGGLNFFLGADGVEVFQISAPCVSNNVHWDTKIPSVAMTAYGSNADEGEYRQIFLIWDRDEGLRFYQGGAGGRYPVHRSQKRTGPTSIFGRPRLIRIGDFDGGNARRAYTFLDELYIYDRALTYEECVWSNKNVASRDPGTDIPADFAAPAIEIIPDPENNRSQIRVDSGNLEAEVHGSVRLEPAIGVLPASIAPDGKRYGGAWIAYTELRAGDYQVIAEIADAQGEAIGTAMEVLTVPEDPGRWLGNTIGKSDRPPPPWTDMRANAESVDVWGRTYRLGELGLPSRIETQNSLILDRPIELRVLDSNGKPFPWRETTRRLERVDAVEANITGVSMAGEAIVNWRCQAEYDGMLRYDFAMPAGVSGSGLEFRVPIARNFATLWYTDQYMSGLRGKIPDGDGVVWRGSWLPYLWLGNESVGFCAFQEDDRGWIIPNDDGMRIEREGNVVTLVYDLSPKAFKLDEPWTFTFGLMATPVKPKPANWRRLRANAPGANIDFPWPSKDVHRYFSLPSPKDPARFKQYINGKRKEGKRVIFFSGLNFISPEVPEYVWFRREWANPAATGDKTDKFPTWTFLSVVPSWIDFIVWKNVQLMEQCGYDGIYVDFAGARFPTHAPQHGLGYQRDGKQRAGLPIWNTREAWKRVYTAFRRRNPDSLIVGHVSGAEHAPILSFCDIWLDGEGNWPGQLRDNYLDVLSLDVLRAEFMGHPFGAVSWWLPQWNHSVPSDTVDVAGRNSDGSIVVSPRLAHNMFGLGLLHDLSFWPICGTNGEASKQFYGAIDEFGLTDAEFFGYWENADLIGGQSETIKVAVYSKPQGGALLVIFNTSCTEQDVRLSINWERLNSRSPIEVEDAYSHEAVAVSRHEMTVDVPPFNYRLLQVR
jgi:hypothetical protein